MAEVFTYGVRLWLCVKIPKAGYSVVTEVDEYTLLLDRRLTEYDIVLQVVQDVDIASELERPYLHLEVSPG